VVLAAREKNIETSVHRLPHGRRETTRQDGKSSSYKQLGLPQASKTVADVN
jgi:hypothetical protein